MKRMDGESPLKGETCHLYYDYLEYKLGISAKIRLNRILAEMLFFIYTTQELSGYYCLLLKAQVSCI